jgi:hypothetical protein
MPWVLVIIGALLVIVGVRDKTEEFQEILADDFSGRDSFVNWMIAVFIIGAFGSYRPLRPVADGFLILLVLAVFLQGNFIESFRRQISPNAS